VKSEDDGATWSTPETMVDISTFTTLNDASDGFLADKVIKATFVCSNDPAKSKIISMINVKDSDPLKQKSGMFTSDDFLTWTLDTTLFTPRYLDSTKDYEWYTKSTLLRYGNDFNLYWANNDLGDPTMKGVFQATTAGPTWPY